MQQICHITGQQDEAANMLRFVRAPDGEWTPDLAEKLPGEAVWTGNRKYLVADLASREAAVADLAERVEKLMRRQLAALLGLARKAGKLVTGFAKTEAALKTGQAHLLVTASDAGEDGRQKLGRLAAHHNVPVFTDLTAAELTMALGRENVIHAGLIDVGWARNLIGESRRLAAYLGGEGQE